MTPDAAGNVSEPTSEATDQQAATPLVSPPRKSTNIADFLRLLHAAGDVFEVRIPNTPDKHGQNFKATASGYFDDPAKAEQWIRQWEQRAQPGGIYCTLNAAPRHLLARANNRLEWRAKHTTADGDIAMRRWILLDIDSIRPAGISATKDEVNEAVAVSVRIRQWLAEQGWPQPLRAMSGNGVYLLYRCELPNNAGTTIQASDLLKVLAKRFDTAGAHVDTSTYNASRICKVLGTMARKGDHLEERPHRQSYFIVPEGEILPVDSSLIHAVLAMDQTQPTSDAEMADIPVTVYSPDVGNRSPADDSVVERCRRYLAAIPPAIQGQNGSQKTLQAAATGARFGIPADQFRPLLVEYSERCVPPWSDAEIEHKLTDGYRKATEDGEWGKFRRDDKTGDPGASEKPKEDREEPTFKPLTAAELDAAELHIDYIVPGVVAAGQALTIAGLFKTLKSSTAFDLGLSAATATRFLRRFDVPTKRRTLVLTAESGLPTVQETLRRMCRARGLSLGTVEGLSVCDRVPRLDNPLHLRELRSIIEAEKFALVIADPAYLMLDGADAGNLFTMGEQLRRFAELTLSCGATPTILHHARKNALNATEYQPLELADLAWAGFAEFSRQWLLLSRRARYVEGSGEHLLWMSAGGSAGHNGCWALDIIEGHPDDEGGRRWDVEIRDAQEARQAAAEDAQQRREAAKREKVVKTLEANRDKVVSAFRGIRPPRLTKSKIRDRSGLNSSATDAVVAYMIRIGELQDGVQVVATNGQKYDGYELIYEDAGA